MAWSAGHILAGRDSNINCGHLYNCTDEEYHNPEVTNCTRYNRDDAEKLCRLGRRECGNGECLPDDLNTVAKVSENIGQTNDKIIKHFTRVAKPCPRKLCKY